MPGEHSSKQYDMDLETIRSKVLLMGGLVESQFHDAVACFRSGNIGPVSYTHLTLPTSDLV